MPEHLQYSEKTDSNMKTTGFTSPEGLFYSFDNNEQGLVQFDRHNIGKRETYVELEDGTLKPVAVYIAERS